MGSTGVVRRIIIGKRRGVLEYTVFTKDEKPVNLLNLTNPFEPVELLLHAIEGSYVLRVIPEPINLNPEPSIRSYYMTTEEI